MSCKLALFSAAFMLVAAPTWATTSPDYLPFHPKEPVPKIFLKSDIGGKNARVQARIDSTEAQDWCSNWRATDTECATNLMSEMGDKTYTASANCQTGALTDTSGEQFIFDGLVRNDENWEGHFKFKDAKTGQPIGTDNASGGLTLATQWIALCPFGLPYDILPMQTVIDTGVEKVFSKVRIQDIIRSEYIGHNGSNMRIDPDTGTITYDYPKSKSIKPNTVLFRGSIIYGGPVRGMAYVFKKGCEPAPYYVEGDMRFETNNLLILEGSAPVREGCKVVGYTEKSPNSKLIFEFSTH